MAVPLIPVDSLMCFYTLCASAGEDPFSQDDQSVVSRESGLRALDLCEQPVAVARTDHGHVRVDVFVGHQVEQEVDVARLGPTDRDVHGEGAATGARRAKRTAPEPSATPPRIRAIPASSSQVSGSPSRRTP